MVTIEDIKKVAGIASRLRELGVPKNICKSIDVWNKKREEKLQRKLVTAERL